MLEDSRSRGMYRKLEFSKFPVSFIFRLLDFHLLIGSFILSFSFPLFPPHSFLCFLSSFYPISISVFTCFHFCFRVRLHLLRSFLPVLCLLVSLESQTLSNLSRFLRRIFISLGWLRVVKFHFEIFQDVIRLSRNSDRNKRCTKYRIEKS